MARRPSTIFACTECGSQSPKWLGRCPECSAWGTLTEEISLARTEGSRATRGAAATVISITEVQPDDAPRKTSGIAGFDRVLGGGIVPGSLILVGGEPGIGKSTLLLQAAEQMAKQGTVLYVSGEESPRQIALRAARLGTLDPAIRLCTETSCEAIIETIETTTPGVAIIDSIQTIHSAQQTGSAGSIGQVRETAGLLMNAAKRLGVPLFLIGHVTKEGTIAGPKTLEHIVDTVLYFEGDKFHHYRMVRAWKNRFGPVNEVALFEMHDDGLEEVTNPSAALLAQRSNAAGSSVVAAVEGTRAIMIEVQALTSTTTFPTPRRTAMGIDSNRLALLLAVLDRRAGSRVIANDVYVNLAGGISVEEPAVDLGIIAALLSSERNLPIAHDLALFGEVGLLGEVRGVSQPDARAREAVSLGFRRLVVPEANRAQIRADIEVVAIRRIDEIAAILFGR